MDENKGLDLHSGKGGDSGNVASRLGDREACGGLIKVIRTNVLRTCITSTSSSSATGIILAR